MSAFTLIGNNSGTFFCTSDGVNAQAYPNTAVNKPIFYALLDGMVTQATDGNYNGDFVAYVNTGLTFTQGTTENLTLSQMLEGTPVDVTQALQYGVWLQSLTIAGHVVSWTRQNSLNTVRLVPAAGTTDTLNTLTVTNVVDGDVVILKNNLNTYNITVTTAGNITLSGTRGMILNGYGDGITLQWNATATKWQEVSRTQVFATTNDTVIVAADGLVSSLNPATDAPVQVYTGTGALLGNVAISGTGSPSDGFTWRIFYKATFTGSSTVTIFGATLDANQVSLGNTLVEAVYDANLAGYRVTVIQSAQGLYVSNGNIVSLDASKLTGTAPSGTIPQLTPGKINLTSALMIVGSAGNVGAAVAPSGDVTTLTNTGAFTINKLPQIFADATARANATPRVIGELGFQVDTQVLYFGSTIAANGWSPAQVQSPYFSFSLLVPTASILTGNTAPVQAIGTPGAGIAIEIISAFSYMTYAGAAYAVHTDIELITDTATIAQFTGTAVLAGTVTRGAKLAATAVSGATDTQLISNKPVMFKVPTGDPTTGTSDITLYGSYRIVTL